MCNAYEWDISQMYEIQDTSHMYVTKEQWIWMRYISQRPESHEYISCVMNMNECITQRPEHITQRPWDIAHRDPSLTNITCVQWIWMRHITQSHEYIRCVMNMNEMYEIQDTSHMYVMKDLSHISWGCIKGALWVLRAHYGSLRVQYGSLWVH